MTPLWTGDEFTNAVGGTVSGELPAAVAGISIDSRTVAQGEAFFAIKGDRFDGHDFVESAFNHGAALAVVSRYRDLETPKVGPLVVLDDDPLDGLERLASSARARCSGTVVAVTGSVGKTSTKEMLRAAFSECGATHASVGSFNNHWGVPLSLARLPAETRFGVFEIGMNHPGEIVPLSGLVRPHIAMITNVGAVHLEFFSNVKAIAEAKAEIFAGLETGGTAILNRDNEWFDLLADHARACGARIISFGYTEDADVCMQQVKIVESVTSVRAMLFGTPIIYKIGAPGRHLAVNSLAVLAAVEVAGGDTAKAAIALARFKAPKGRGERLQLWHPAGAFEVIDESYNANPVSMRAALELLGAAKPAGRGRRVAVLGDMLELGADSSNEHIKLCDPIAEYGADLVFLVGPEMKKAWEALPDTVRGAYAGTAAELEPILLSAVRPGDVVMIKASLGTGLGPLVQGLSRRYAPENRNEKDTPMADERVQP